jgi:hypothetical protein
MSRRIICSLSHLRYLGRHLKPKSPTIYTGETADVTYEHVLTRYMLSLDVSRRQEPRLQSSLCKSTCITNIDQTSALLWELQLHFGNGACHHQNSTAFTDYLPVATSPQIQGSATIGHLSFFPSFYSPCTCQQDGFPSLGRPSRSQNLFYLIVF